MCMMASTTSAVLLPAVQRHSPGRTAALVGRGGRIGGGSRSGSSTTVITALPGCGRRQGCPRRCRLQRRPTASPARARRRYRCRRARRESRLAPFSPRLAPEQHGRDRHRLEREELLGGDHAEDVVPGRAADQQHREHREVQVQIADDHHTGEGGAEPGRSGLVCAVSASRSRRGLGPRDGSARDVPARRCPEARRSRARTLLAIVAIVMAEHQLAAQSHDSFGVSSAVDCVSLPLAPPD